MLVRSSVPSHKPCCCCCEWIQALVHLPPHDAGQFRRAGVVWSESGAARKPEGGGRLEKFYNIACIQDPDPSRTMRCDATRQATGPAHAGRAQYFCMGRSLRLISHAPASVLLDLPQDPYHTLESRAAGVPSNRIIKKP